MANKKRDRYFIVRNILNILFMLVAGIGVYIYICQDEMKGTVVIIFGMLFKMAESCLRLPLFAPKKARTQDDDDDVNEDDDDQSAEEKKGDDE